MDICDKFYYYNIHIFVKKWKKLKNVFTNKNNCSNILKIYFNKFDVIEKSFLLYKISLGQFSRPKKSFLNLIWKEGDILF